MKRRGLGYAIAAVVFVAVVTGAVAAWALTAPTSYVARAQVLLTPIAAGDHTFDGFSVLRESSDPGRAARTAALLFATPQVAEGVRVQLGLDQSAASLLKSVKVTTTAGRNLVTVAASAGGPQRAADLANAFAAQAIAARTAHFQSELQTAIARARSRLAAIPPVQRVLPASRALQERLGTLNGLVGTSDPTLEVGSAATAPTAPERSRSLVWIPVAFGASMLLALLVLAVALLSRRRADDRHAEATQLAESIDGRMSELLAEQERVVQAREELGDLEARNKRVAVRETELDRRVSVQRSRMAKREYTVERMQRSEQSAVVGALGPGVLRRPAVRLLPARPDPPDQRACSAFMRRGRGRRETVRRDLGSRTPTARSRRPPCGCRPARIRAACAATS